MKLVFLNCFDILNPRHGGAEKFTFNIAKRFAQEGNEVVWIASNYKSGRRREHYEGVEFRRFGNRITVLIYSFYYLIKYRKTIDYVFDQFHAYPFFAVFFVPRQKFFSIIHEVAGSIWNYMSTFPFNIIGRTLELFTIKVLYRNRKFITVSESTKNDLLNIGISKKNISIVQNGTDVKDIPTVSKKRFQLINFGGIRKMKRIEDQINAVEILKDEFPEINLKITGKKEGAYYNSLVKLVQEKDLENHITFAGFLDEKELQALIAASYINIGTSVKEGWGLVVTESASLATPSVCYKVNGYIDSIMHFQTGLITIKNTPESLAKGIKRLLIDEKLYKKLQSNAMKETKDMTWDKSFEQFKTVIGSKSKRSRGKEKHSFSSLEAQILY